jgi:hypothetical protein
MGDRTRIPKKLSEWDKAIILAKIQIKVHEGFSDKAYWDYNGYAIGYGLHLEGLGRFSTITKKKADQELDIDIRYRLTELKKILPFYPKMQYYHISALLGIMFNKGVNGYKQTSLHEKLLYCGLHHIKVQDCRVRKEFADMHPRSEPHVKRHKLEWLVFYGDPKTVSDLRKLDIIKDIHSDEYVKQNTQYLNNYLRFKYSGDIEKV